MHISLQQLVDSSNNLLRPETFSDYCPNGLQIDAGVADVRKIVSGVTASMALIEAAVAAEADVLLVHHGYFWRGEPAALVAMKGQRVATLIRNNISLMAYHLPLDAHPELGNNARLARLMDWIPQEVQPGIAGLELVWFGELQRAMSFAEMRDDLQVRLQHPCIAVEGAARPIKRIAWCTGAAQSMFEAVASHGVDAFVSGEISEQSAHIARELGVHYFAAGHHATERYGVQALGDYLARQFGIEHQFIDIANPA